MGDLIELADMMLPRSERNMHARDYAKQALAKHYGKDKPSIANNPPTLGRLIQMDCSGNKQVDEPELSATRRLLWRASKRKD